ARGGPLMDPAIGLTAGRGVRNSSLAEASRRLHVAVSAPYAHFADRDELLAAVAVRAYEHLYAELKPELSQARAPADRLAAMAGGYVRFAPAPPPPFGGLNQGGLDKARHPEAQAARRPGPHAFPACVRAPAAGDEALSEDLATAVEATAHGHAVLLLDGGSGQAPEAVERAAGQAARATLALVEGRHLLGGPSS